MEESIDSFFQLNKGTSIGDFYNLSGQACSNRIFFGNGVPRIVSYLLQSQGNTASLDVITQNHALYLITNLHHVRSLVNLLYPRELADVSQAFDSFFQLDEGTKVGELGNSTLYYVIYVVLVFKVQPRIFAEVLQRKIDALLFWVKADNLQLDFLTLLYKVLRTSYVTPAHVIDVQQSIEATQVNEGTKAGEALYSTLNGITNGDVVKECVTIGLHGLLKVLAAVYYHVCLVVTVQALNIELAGKTKQLLCLLHLLAIRLADGKECLDTATKVYIKTTLYNLFDSSFNRSLIIQGLS